MPAQGKPEPIKSLPARFDAAGLVTEQFEATSADGTKIPYFITACQKDAKGPMPTILYGYGGFEISLTPSYSAQFRPAVADQGRRLCASPTSAAAASSVRPGTTRR